MNRGILAGLVIAAAAPLAFAAGGRDVDAISDRCSTGGGREQMECRSQQIDRLNGDLDRAYEDALARLPEHDANDLRGSRGQLRASEATWEQYQHANRPLVGAMQGGSNLWITYFALICQEQEIHARTDWLKQIANGTFGDR